MHRLEDTPGAPLSRRSFSWRGSHRTHRAALGPDLHALLNVALAPVLLLIRLAALVPARLRLRRAERWLASRRILLRPDVSGAIERAVINEVLRPRSQSGGPLSAASARLVEDNVGIRCAVAEIVTTLLPLGVGLAVFRAATPGVLSLAPIFSDHAAFSAAIAAFPLGRDCRIWHGIFPADRPGWFVA